MKKRKQHHVWKAYLRAWATKEKLWVLQDGRIRTADIADVAMQRDFYKLNALTPADVEFIRKYWIEPLHPSSRRVNENYLFMFSAWATMRENLSETQAAANPAYVQFLEEQIINAEEEFHAGVENRAAPLIHAARSGDVSFYGMDDHAMSFIHFLSVQHFRTSGMKQRVVERFKTNLGIDISRCWNIISHILATSVGSSLFLDRKQRPLVLLKNDTDVPFVTSDQPTVNLLGSGFTDPGPEHLALYYPLSPKLALLLDEPGKPCGIGQSLTTEDIDRLNEAEIQASNRQVFGSVETSLSRYISVEA